MNFTKLENEQQYKVTKMQAEKFERTLERLIAHESERAHIHPRLREAEEESMRSVIDILRAELKEYEGRHKPQSSRVFK